MDAVNPATKFVEEARSWSAVHEYVADHGEPICNSEIDQDRIGGRNVAVSTQLSDSERRLVEEAIAETDPTSQTCFANALRMWQYDNRFAYVEGFAIGPDTDFGFEHAWCLLNGEKLVDVTTRFNDYHGAVVVDEEVLQRYAREAEASYGIIGDHRNQFQFLRERDYL